MFSGTAANLVLEQTIERIYVGEQYAEKNLGLFLVRGDNIVLLGPIVLSPPPSCPTKRVHASKRGVGGGGLKDESREELCVKGLTKVTLPEIEAARKAEREAKRAQWELKQKMNQDPWS